MKTNKLILLFTSLSLMLNGCIVVTTAPVPTITEQIELTETEIVPGNPDTPTIPIETVTPTEESIVDTSTSTIVPTETLVPTPTEILPVEWDIDPYIIKEIEGVYRGVTIKGRFIVDRSLEDTVESIEINDDVFAEMIAKSLALVWIERQKAEPWELAKPIELNKWIDLWAKAQETGSEYYWRQVQLNTIWANDLNDGNGYVEKPYIFWPMYEGVSPYEVTALHKISIVFFDPTKKGITNTEYMLNAVMMTAFGSSLNNQDLILYLGHDMGFCVPYIAKELQYSQKRANQYCLSTCLLSLPGYFMYNDGDSETNGILSVSTGIFGLMERAIKYEIKGE